METAVWDAIETMIACPTAPRQAGRADLRIEYRAGQAPAVEWRDTYAPDVQRLDRGRVLGCLAQPIRRTRPRAGVQRLLLSFRFRLE